MDWQVVTFATNPNVSFFLNQAAAALGLAEGCAVNPRIWNSKFQEYTPPANNTFLWDGSKLLVNRGEMAADGTTPCQILSPWVGAELSSHVGSAA